MSDITDNEAGYPGQADDDLIEKFARWRKDDDAHFGEWRDEAKEAFDLVAGTQWTQEDRDQMEANRKQAVVFNRIQPVIDAVSGAEITGRQKVTYLPRQVGASGPNEVLSDGADWIRDRCDAEQEESDAARDTFICGVGWTETRMDYEEDADGKVVIERIDPLEITPDCTSRKANYADARRLRRDKPYSQDEFDELWPGASPGGRMDDLGKRPTVVDPRVRYTNGDGDDDDGESIVVSEWQWYEKEPFYRVAHPDTGEVVHVAPEDYEPMAAQAQSAGVELGGVRQVQRVYYRAFESGGQLLQPVERLQVHDFTYKAMTGKRDRNKGSFYGLVRSMSDPQKYANKTFSQILHIMNSNAKGGLMMEPSAAVDQRQFEESWAKTDAITWMADGALSGPNPKIKVKEPPAYPAAQDKVMELSVVAIRDSTGVNQELLGLADRDQPGVLEHQRKQAAYGILAAFFDSFKRYRKMQGRLLLRMMQLFLPPNTLVRIVGDDGTAQYVPMALNDQTIEFDVIVDDAPAGPNQKEITWQAIVQMMPILQTMNLPPAVWLSFLPYAPFNAALTQKITQAVTDAQQQAAQAPPTPMEQVQLGLGQAKIANDQASANHHNAQAAALQARASAEGGKAPGEAQLNDAQAALARARAATMTAKLVPEIMQSLQPSPTSPQ